MAEVVHCRRFLAAWRRTQANNKQQSDSAIVKQYQQLALHFEQLLTNSDELKPFEPELACISRQIALLKNEWDAVKPGRILRASETAMMQMERAKSSNIPEAVVKSIDQEPLTGKHIKKDAVSLIPEVRPDLCHDDYKSMLEVAAPLEENLSTKAIRKRLGLVNRLGCQTSASEAVAREEQESIQSEMISLARQLKDRTRTINQSLTEDIEIIDAVGQSAESNTALLDRENAMLNKQLASSIDLWTSLWLVAMLVIIFLVTYFYIRLFSRR